MENTFDISNIEKYISAIKKGIEWAEVNLPHDKKLKTKKLLIDQRRHLNKLNYASQLNASAALYGESQVGKSYLVKNMLSELGKEFMVLNPAINKWHNFIEEINPTGGVESTGVITRFTTSLNIINPNYPIKIKLFSIKDILLLLADSAFSELSSNIPVVKRPALEERLNAFIQKYGQQSIIQNHLSIDDIYDIEDYFKQYHSSALAYINACDVDFWHNTADIIERVPINEFVELFSFLWSDSVFISNVFSSLINQLKELEFDEFCWAEFSSVLRDENGTILDVSLLKTLNDISKVHSEHRIKILTNSGRKELQVSQSLLCALIGELAIEVDKQLEQSKPFLKDLDLIDFPGARARKEINEDAIKESVHLILLRGKVAYIFNKYTDEYLLSNLLFCNRGHNVEANYAPRLINNWIEKFIGTSPEEREKFISDSKVSPLFMIFTWFNNDLGYKSAADINKESLNEKWIRRFNRVFEEEIVTKNYNWNKNWTSSSPKFMNNFMLRDMRLSEELSGLYTGYREHQEEKERVQINYGGGDYWRDLEDSFVNFNYVQEHFKDAQKAWNESATMNNDGTKPIIDALSVVSGNQARTNKFKRDVQRIFATVKAELVKHYHDQEKSDNLTIALSKAGKIQLDLDTTFGKDPYFFGKFVERMQIKESDIYNYYHNRINDIKLIEGADLSEYVAIRLANPDLSINATDEENLAVLKKTYKIQSDQELIDYLGAKNINIQELFRGEANRIRSNSSILAEGLVEKWFNENLDISNFTEFEEMGVLESNIAEIITNLKLQFEQQDLESIIAARIRVFVDRYDKIDQVQEMIADISAALINNFVNTFGFQYYSPEKINELEKSSETMDLGLRFNHDFLSHSIIKEQELQVLFETINDLENLLNQMPLDINSLKNVPSFSEFTKWKDYMKLSFVSVCDIPTYDVVANDKLHQIISELNA